MNKMHYSYFLIKPDGIKDFKKIREKISSKGFDRVLYYAVDNWEIVQKDLYEDHYVSKEGTDFADSYEAFADAEKILFGNKSIIALVAAKGPYQQLMDTVFNTKLEIRKELGYKVGLVTMQKKPTDENKVLLLDNKKDIKRCKRFDEKGIKYRLNHLDVIHCPDPNLRATLRELRKILNQGVINDRNLISSRLEYIIDKYKTGEVIQDIRDAQNQLYTSGYSEHIKYQIQRDEEQEK